jgi:hypothetical protein
MTSDNTRLATWIAPDASKRLRIYALVHGLRIGEALTQVLRTSLPTAEALAAQLAGRTEDR